MATQTPVLGESCFLLRMPDLFRRMTDEEFFEFCAANRELRIERTPEGDILVMPPASSETGGSNSSINRQLGNWALRDGTGKTFDSSSGFTLPNNAMYAPDASWILKTRWNSLSRNEKRRFAHICPDFVVELKSPSDSISFLQAKMEEYAANGARLGWLIDPDRRRVYVYRPGETVVTHENVVSISGSPELRGFTLELAGIWDPDTE